jgi:hypothetical protein
MEAVGQLVGFDLQKKWALNSMADSADASHESVLCVRMSRVNHSCDPNTSHYFVGEWGIMLMYALRDIEKDSELRFNYMCNWIASAYRGMSRNVILRGQYRIECPDDCHCRDSEWRRVRESEEELSQQVLELAQQGLVQRALKLNETRLGLLKSFDCDQMELYSCLYDSFQIAIMEKKNKLAKEFAEQALEVVSEILTPDHPLSQRIQGFANDPKQHKNFGVADLIKAR